MSDPREEWRPCWHGRYEVSDAGRVRRAVPGKRTYVGRLVAAHANPGGYLVLRLYAEPDKQGARPTRVQVHKLVAETFLGPCPEGHEVNHRDGNPANNHVSNLEYVTHSDNLRHAARAGLLGAAKLSPGDVRRIRHRVAAGELQRTVGFDHGIGQTQVSRIVNGKQWSHVS